MTRNVFGVIRTQEQNEAGDIIGFTEAGLRNVFEPFIHLRFVLAQVRRHFGDDHAWADGIDADIIRCKFAGALASEADQTGLAGDVGGAVAQSGGAAGDGADVDDDAAAHFFHAPADGLGAEKSALEVDVEGAIPGPFVKGQNRSGRLNSGIVDERIHAPPFFQYFVVHRLHGHFVGYVGDDCQGLAVVAVGGHHVGDLFGGGGGGVGVDVVDDDFGSGSGEA